jgi:hypothetical protein
MQEGAPPDGGSSGSGSPSPRTPSTHKAHRKTKSSAQDALEALQEYGSGGGGKRHLPKRKSGQNVFDDQFFKEEDEEKKEEAKEPISRTSSTEGSLPLLSGGEYGSVEESAAERGIASSLTVSLKKRGPWRKLAYCCRPRRVIEFLRQLFQHSYMMLFAIPLAVRCAKKGGSS